VWAQRLQERRRHEVVGALIEWSGWTPVDISGSLRSADLQAMGVGRQSAEWDLGMGDVTRAAKIAAGENVGEVPGDQPDVRVQEGFIFETVVDYTLAGVPFDEAVDLAFKRYALAVRPWLRQIRLVKDRIRLTPDAIDPRVPEIVSVKSTRRSLRNARTQDDFESNFWTWVMADSGYALAAGLDRVRWIVWWQAGDYSKGKGTGPQVLEATARFSGDELEANWKGVCAIAARLRAKEAA
jgi:hypothetical protein